MKDSLSTLFSYLFMVAVFIAVITAFGMIIIVLRAVTMDISSVEKQVAFLFLYTFVASIILAPIFLYISSKLEKHGKRLNQI